MKSESVTIQLLKRDLEYIKAQITDVAKDLTEVKTEIKNQYVTKDEFDSRVRTLENQVKPLEKLIYGLVGLILVGVFGALLAGVLK